MKSVSKILERIEQAHRLWRQAEIVNDAAEASHAAGRIPVWETFDASHREAGLRARLEVMLFDNVETVLQLAREGLNASEANKGAHERALAAVKDLIARYPFPPAATCILDAIYEAGLAIASRREGEDT